VLTLIGQDLPVMDVGSGAQARPGLAGGGGPASALHQAVKPAGHDPPDGSCPLGVPTLELLKAVERAHHLVVVLLDVAPQGEVSENVKGVVADSIDHEITDCPRIRSSKTC
jgi:hypothetical protein